MPVFLYMFVKCFCSQSLPLFSKPYVFCLLQIMQRASETLIPVTLELGGKDSFIVCEDVDLPNVRIICCLFHHFMNSIFSSTSPSIVLKLICRLFPFEGCSSRC